MGVHTIHTSCNLGMNIHINQPNREVHLQGHMEFPCILHLPRSGTACHHVLHQTTPAKFDKEPTKSTKCIKLYQDTISTHNQQTGQLPDPISGGSIMKKKNAPASQWDLWASQSSSCRMPWLMQRHDPVCLKMGHAPHYLPFHHLESLKRLKQYHKLPFGAATDHPNVMESLPKS